MSKNNSPEDREPLKAKSYNHEAGKPEIGAEREITPNAGKINTRNLKSALSLELSPEDLNIPLQPSRMGKDRIEELLDEAVEDILHLMERMSRMEEKINAIQAILSGFQQSVHEGFRNYALELERMKEELLSERKAFIGRSTFHSIIPAIESLQITRSALDGEKDQVFYAQVTAVMDLLENILRGIGYIPYAVEPGESFDPAFMECLGYSHGETGKVIRMERSGYKSGNRVVKPCGVIIGKEE